MKSGFCDTLLKINNNNDIMKDIVLLSFTGLYVIMINYRFYNKINKLQSKNRDLQDKVEYLKYELSKHNSLNVMMDGLNIKNVNAVNMDSKIDIDEEEDQEGGFSLF